MLGGDVVERHLLGPDDIVEPDLVRLAPDFAGDRVDHQLQREADAGARHPAEGEDRRLVRGDRPGLAAEGVHQIGPGQDRGDLGRFEAGGERVGRIGAGIDRGLGVERQQPAFGVGIAGDDVVVLAAIGVGGQMLAPVLEPAHRTLQMPGQPGDADLLRRQDPLVAEPAADIGRDHPDARMVEAEAFGDPGADDMRKLGGRDHGELAQPAVPFGEHALALDRRHALARGAELAGDLDRGAGGDGFDVVLDTGLQEHVVAPRLVDQRRVRIARRQHVGDRRQNLEIDRHAVGHVLGLGAAGGDADRDRLAHLAHLFEGERGLRGGLEPGQSGDRADRLDARHVGVGEDPRPDVVRDVDAGDERMRDGAADEGGLELAGEAEIADIAAAAAHQPVVLLAGDGRAHPLICHVPAPPSRYVAQRFV